MKTVTLLTAAKSAAALITLCLALMGSPARAQNSGAILTRYAVKQQYREQLRKKLSDYVLHSIATKGNVMAEAYYEQQDTTVLWLIERWVSKNELKKFTNGVQGTALKHLSETMLAEPVKTIYVNDLEPISKQQWRKPAKKEDDPLTIMLFVDVKPGTQEKFKDVYRKALPAFRNEAGVVTYQLSQIEDDVTQFVTYEKFRSNDAFQYHLKFPPIQPVVDFLNSSIKEQPFQKGLHNLIEFAPLTRE